MTNDLTKVVTIIITPTASRAGAPMYEIEADVRAAHLSGRSLKQREIDCFNSLGVSALALAAPWPVLADRVVITGQYFDFARDVGDEGSKMAFTIGVLGIGGLTDIVAWDPQTDRMASWLGRGFALGEKQIFDPYLNDEWLQVWRSPLNWLHASRAGVVILRPEHACFMLAHLPSIIAEDEPHRVELEHLLGLDSGRESVDVYPDTQGAV